MNEDGIHLNMGRLKREFDKMFEYYSSIRLKLNPERNEMEDDYGNLFIKLNYLKDIVDECRLKSNLIASWGDEPRV